VSGRPLVLRRLAAVVGLLLAITGCGPAPQPRPAGDLLVFAASPLTEVFTAIGDYLEQTYPGLRLSFRFGGSRDLAEQLAAGEAADVFAAVGSPDMALVSDARELRASPAVFARTQLVIAVAKGNPAGVAKLADLAALRVALCDPQTACGSASNQVLAAANVTVTPVSIETDSRSALARIVEGSADAALAYRTDARFMSSDVDTIEFVESVAAAVNCEIVVLDDAANPTAAELFVSVVTSDQAREVLAQAGFRDPA